MPQPACTEAREALTVLPAGRPANLLSNACLCRQNLQRAVRGGLMGQQNIRRNLTLDDKGLLSCRCGRYVLLILRLFNNGVSTAQINMIGNVRRMEYIRRIRLTLNIPRRGGPLRTPEGDFFCYPAVTISTNLLLIFVCVPHQLKINIM